jgi:aminoglycoside 3-N-acetyltransferase
VSLGLIRKFIENYKKLPELLVARVVQYLNKKNCTSEGKLTPSQVSVEQITSFLTRSGVVPGDLIFVHSSWDNLNSGHFSASELIEVLTEYVGESGTLGMPAIPSIPHVDGAVFKVKRTPSAAGMLTEVFRRYPGVLRSINLNHSVCARGPAASYLIRDHQLSETSWDQYSPYYRLGEYENAWIIGLGVGHRLQVATSLHCVESVLWKDNRFFNKLFSKQICYQYLDEAGAEGEHCYRARKGQIYTPKVASYFTKEELIEETIGGLDVYAIKAKTLIDRSIELGQRGRTMYVWPIPWFWLFK